MESASDLIARKLPPLLHIRGTRPTDPSVSHESVSATLLHIWPNFLEDVVTACRSVNLSGQISLTDSAEEEKFAVGSARGFAGRVVNNLCSPVAKALSVTPLSNLRFGDAQAVKDTVGLPDVVAFLLRNTNTSPPNEQGVLIMAGELKPSWNLTLVDVRSPLQRRRRLEPHVGTYLDLLHAVDQEGATHQNLQTMLGQLVSYMRLNFLKYGFLSTYEATIFVRRVSDYRFELSPPIDWQATGPSVRECLLGISIIASNDAEYFEGDDFDVTRLRASGFPSGFPFVQASTSIRTSAYRRFEECPEEPTRGVPNLRIGHQTILFGDGGVSESLVHCLRLIRGTPGKKAVFEVKWQETIAIAKCWSEEYYESYATEAAVYEKLYEMRPQGYDVFASVLEYGNITCSSIFPSGRVLVLTKAQGQLLSEVWDELSLSAKSRVRDQCRKAVGILRKIPIYSSDAGKHNVLYSTTTETVTMLDFESVGVCTEDEVPVLDDPELTAIFGEEYA